MALPSSTRSQYLNNLTQPTTLSSDNSDCLICHETMSVKDFNIARRAVYAHDDRHPCCRDCLTTWTIWGHTCPMCRVSLYESDSEDVEMEDEDEVVGDEEYIDEMRLHLLRYQRAVRAGEESRIDMFLRVLVNEIQERVHSYLGGFLPMDVEYRAPPNRTFSSNYPEADENTPLQLLNARTVIMGLWKSWQFLFLQNVSAPDVFQHPLASALLLEIISALNDWDGTVKEPSTLRVVLGCRVRAFERVLGENGTRLDEGLRESWGVYKEWMVSTVVDVFAAGEEESQMLRKAARGHEVLFEGGMVESVMPRDVPGVSG